MAYIGQSLTEGTRRAYTFVATSGQTTFNAVYGVGAVDVYQNGILLQPSDYNSSSGSSVVLGVGAAVNDEITIIAHNTFSVADTLTASQGGTFTGNVQFDGSFTSKGIDDNADATAITIDSSENVLIGHTDPFSPISNGGSGVSAMANGQLFTGHAGTPFYANREDSDGDIAVFRKDGASVGTVGSAGSGTEFYVAGSGANTSGIYFNGANQAIPMKAGSLSDATQDLGKTNFRWKDLYLSGGVYLGGTGAANKLSDYETGTFSTSLLQCTTTTPSYSVNANRNKYVKIGKLVLAHFDFSFISLSGGAGDVLLNLPFTVNGTENYHSVHAQRNCSAFSGSIADYKINGYGGANSTLIYLLYSTGNSGAESAINASSLQNGRINLNFIYTTSD